MKRDPFVDANSNQGIILRYVVLHVLCVITSLLAKRSLIVGYSRWKAGERYDDRYLAIPPNINEEEFRVLLDNGEVSFINDHWGRENTKCVLTVHPRAGLKK